MDADGKNLVQLTTQDNPDYLPNYSPDGKKIVFTGERDRNADIYMPMEKRVPSMRIHQTGIVYSSETGQHLDYAEGHNKKQLTNNDNKTAHGPKMVIPVYERYSREVWGEDATMDLDGNNLCLPRTRIIRVDYSPDGQQLRTIGRTLEHLRNGMAALQITQR